MIETNIVEQARNADLIAFLERNSGFTFNQQRGIYRCKQHPSLAVKSDRRAWYWHSKGIGGYGAIDYLMKIEQMPFREAVETVKPGYFDMLPPLRVNLARSPELPKPLVLPEKAAIPLHLYDYLCKKRGIDEEIVHSLIQEEKLYEDRRGNVIFVGYDEGHKPRFACVRGTYRNRPFRMDCIGSDKSYGFNMAADAPSHNLYVFESPIDAMSHASLAIAEFGDKTAWKDDRRLSLAGTSDTALLFFLNQHKSVEQLIFCLDNDSPGRVAANTLQYLYARKGYMARIELPQGKDYNEDLQAFRAQTQREKAQPHRSKGEMSL